MPTAITAQPPRYPQTACRQAAGLRAAHRQCQDQVSFRGTKKSEKTEAPKTEKEPWHWGQRAKNSVKGGLWQVKSDLTNKWTLGFLGLMAASSLIPGVHCFTLTTIPLLAAFDFGFGMVLNFKTDQQIAEKQAKAEAPKQEDTDKA